MRVNPTSLGFSCDGEMQIRFATWVCQRELALVLDTAERILEQRGTGNAILLYEVTGLLKQEGYDTKSGQFKELIAKSPFQKALRERNQIRTGSETKRPPFQIFYSLEALILNTAELVARDTYKKDREKARRENSVNLRSSDVTLRLHERGYKVQGDRVFNTLENERTAGRSIMVAGIPVTVTYVRGDRWNGYARLDFEVPPMAKKIRKAPTQIPDAQKQILYEQIIEGARWVENKGLVRSRELHREINERRIKMNQKELGEILLSKDFRAYQLEVLGEDFPFIFEAQRGQIGVRPGRPSTMLAAPHPKDRVNSKEIVQMFQKLNREAAKSGVVVEYEIVSEGAEHQDLNFEDRSRTVAEGGNKNRPEAFSCLDPGSILRNVKFC